jgi:hypothetical protein
MVAPLLGAIDDAAELELEPIDHRAELSGVDLAVVQPLNFPNRKLVQDHANIVQMFVANVKR